MECSISIAGGIAYRQGNQSQIDSFNVFGVALGCTELTVSLSYDPALPPDTNTVTVNSNGAWSAQFDLSQSGLDCADITTSLDIGAQCTDNPNCSAENKFDNITCQIADACPVFRKFEAITVSNSDGGCNADLEREVQLTATLSDNVPSGLPVIAQFCLRNLDSGEEVFLGAGELQPDQPFVDSIHVPGGPYLYQLKILSPAPCPGPLGVLVVQSCPGSDTDTVCPLVIMGDESISANCTPNGQRNVGVSATVTPEPGHPVDAVLRLQSGSAIISELDTQQGLTGETVLSGSQPLDPGDYRAVLAVTSPAACSSSGSEFVVPPCETGDGPDRPPEEQPDDPPGEQTPGGGEVTPTDPAIPSQQGGSIWCIILFWVGLAFFVLGAFAFGIGNCAIGLGVNPIWVGIWALIINIGLIMLIIGTLLLTIWVFLCGSCRVNCDALKFLRDILIVFEVVFGLLTAIGGTLIAISPFCVFGWLIDFGLTTYLLALVYFWVYFTECETYSDKWPEWLRFTMPDSLRAYCGRGG